MINRFRSLFPHFKGRTGFSRSVLTLLTGASSSLFIAYLAQPVLTRLYSPEAFGLFDAFAALVGLIVPFASLRYEDAVMLPEDEDEATGVIALSLVIAILVTLLSIGVYLAGVLTGIWTGNARLTPWLVWVPAVLLSARLAKLGEQWLARRKKFSSISKGQFLQSGVTASTRITMGLGALQATPMGLIAGYLGGYIAGALWYGYALATSSLGLGARFLRPAALLAIAKRYRRFPLFSMPSALLNTLLSRLPVLLLLYFFNAEVVGYFGRAFAIFAIPLSVLGSAFAQVFFVEGAAVRHTEAFSRLTLDVHRRLVMLGLFPALALIVAGPQAIGVILGKNWIMAGEYLRWIAPWLFLAGVASPLTRVFDVLEKQRSDLKASLLMFVIQTTLMIIGGLTGNIATALVLLGIGGVAARWLHIYIIMRLANASINTALKHYWMAGVRCLPVLFGLYAVSLLSLDWLTTLTLIVGGAGLLFWQLVVEEDTSPNESTET